MSQIRTYACVVYAHLQAVLWSILLAEMEIRVLAGTPHTPRPTPSCTCACTRCLVHLQPTGTPMLCNVVAIQYDALALEGAGIKGGLVKHKACEGVSGEANMVD